MADDFETLPIGSMTVMEEAARTFREYESHHRSRAGRCPAESLLQEQHLEKAKRNGVLAHKLEMLLAQKRGQM